MKEEIAAAVVFLKRLVKKNERLTEDQVDTFCNNLSSLLVERFRNHWYEGSPMKGQAYRCIRINDCGPIDTVLDKAATSSGLNYTDLALPPELTLWLDPKEVCCRFSELKGYCFTVASFKNGSHDNKASTLDIDDMLETQKQQRLDELMRLQHHCSRRSNRSTAAKNGATKFRGNVQNSGAPKSQYKWTRSMNSGSVTSSPAKAQMQYFSNPMKRDPFHWVRGQDLVKA